MIIENFRVIGLVIKVPPGTDTSILTLMPELSRIREGYVRLIIGSRSFGNNDYELGCITPFMKIVVMSILTIVD